MQSIVRQLHPVEVQIGLVQTHTIVVETQMSEAHYNPEATFVYF